MVLVPVIAVEGCLIHTGVKSKGSCDFCNMQAIKINRGNLILCLCCFCHLILKQYTVMELLSQCGVFFLLEGEWRWLGLKFVSPFSRV